MNPLPQPYRTQWIRAVLVSLLFAIAASASEQAHPERVPLSLEEALARAANEGLAVQVSRAETREAQGTYLRARADLLPSLDGVLSQRRQDRSQAAYTLPDTAALSITDPIISDIDFPGVPTDFVRLFNLPEESVTTITDPIPLTIDFEDSTGPRDYAGGNLMLSAPLLNVVDYREMKSARANLERVDQAIAARRLEAMAEAARLYTRTTWLETSSATLRDVLALREAQAEMATDLHQSEIITELDVHEQEMRVLHAKQDLATALVQLFSARRNLRRILGIAPETPLELTTPLTYRPIQVDEPEAAAEAALTHRPDYRERLRAQDVARLYQGAATAERYPQVRAVGTYGHEGEQADDTVEAWSIAVVARIPLWDFHGRKGTDQVRRSQLERVQAETLDLEQRILMEVHHLHQTLSLRKSGVKIAERGIVVAEHRLATLRTGQEAGTRRPLDVLKAQVDLASATLKRESAVMEYRLASIDWFKALGRPDALAE